MFIEEDEEWKRYLRTTQSYTTREDFLECILNFKCKTMINFEIEIYSLMEFSNDWLKHVEKHTILIIDHANTLDNATISIYLDDYYYVLF